MVDKWIQEIKTKIDPEQLGMILVHNGIVRASSKEGKPVKYMNLSFDAEKLDLWVNKFKRCDGIEDIRVWINRGALNVGDDIMYVLVAGRFRTDVLPVLQELLSIIKKEIVTEKEVYL
jgi:molybdopterin synthase catalytic subunit